jgi:hypothetical protein
MMWVLISIHFGWPRNSFSRPQSRVFERAITSRFENFHNLCSRYTLTSQLACENIILHNHHRASIP